MSNRLVGMAANYTRRCVISWPKLAKVHQYQPPPPKTLGLGMPILCKNCKYMTIRIQEIHLTKQNGALPPVIGVLLRPIAKFGAMVFGRLARKWWAKLTPEEKEAIRRKIRSRQTHLAAATTVVLGLLFVFYLDNIKEEPITKRKRFILYNDEQMKHIAELEYENQVAEFKSNIVPINHPVYKRIANVANEILLANRELPQIRDKEWAVTVVDLPDVANAFVLPHGKIFVFTGMLNVCSTDDQLATMLSHEISHAVLSHMAESLSKVFVVEMILVLPVALIWFLFSDIGALFSQWLTSSLASLLVHLPFSRSIEREADTVGIQLLARACFDVREAPVLWEKMSKAGVPEMPLEWLSTHPTNESRKYELQQLLPMAFNIRTTRNCPLLPKVIPNTNIPAFDFRLNVPKS